MAKLFIFGAGEFAHIAHLYFSQDYEFDFQGFVVDKPTAKESNEGKNGFPILEYEFSKSHITQENTCIFVAISSSEMNLRRRRVFERLKNLGCKFASYISPLAFVSDGVILGSNVFIFEHNVIQNNVSIGDNTVLWSGNHVGHRSSIGAHVFVASHVVISGFCTIGDNSYLGVNSTIIDKIDISRSTLIGAGALVLKNTEPESVYIGSPARKVIGKDPYKVPL